MATYKETVDRFSDRLIYGIERVNGYAVATASAAGEVLGSVLPKRLPGASYIRNLPRPEEYVKAYWEFVEKLVKSQRTYSLDMVKALAPITGKIWKPANVRKAAA